jgi:hypothetical protein
MEQTIFGQHGEKKASGGYRTACKVMEIDASSGDSFLRSSLFFHKKDL